MASDLVTPSVERCHIIKTRSHTSLYDWYNKFSEGHKEVSNLLPAHIQQTALCNVNICCVKEPSLGNR
jgi:hypothetical protein